MSYVVTGTMTDAKVEMLAFLSLHGVEIPASPDLQLFGTVSDDSHSLMGVAAFNGLWGHVCTMHMAGDGNWLTRELIWRGCNYTFRQLGVQAVLAPIAADKPRALKLARHLGFKDVHRIKEHVVLLQMLREECRWLERLDPRFLH